jgi:hypothetical protein
VQHILYSYGSHNNKRLSRNRDVCLYGAPVTSTSPFNDSAITFNAVAITNTGRVRNVVQHIL